MINQDPKNTLNSETSIKDPLLTKSQQIQGNPQEPKKVIHEYGRHPLRYLMGFIYSLLCLLVGIAHNPLTPVAITVEKAYDADLELINLTTAGYFFTNALFSFPCVFVINKLGMTNAMKLSALWMGVGYALRIQIEHSMWWVVIGQFITGLASPIIIAIQVRFIAEWFHEKERGLWITIVSLSQPIGTLLSNLIPISYITIDGTANKKQNRDEIYWCLVWQAIIAAVIALLTILFWRKGYTRQCIEKLHAQAHYNAQGQKLSIREEIIKHGAAAVEDPDWKKKLFYFLKRKYLIAVVLNYGISFGVITGAGALLTEILHSIGYDEVYGGLSNIVAIATGLVSSIAYSITFMNKTNQFKGCILLVIFLAGTNWALFSCYKYFAHPNFILLLNGLIGIFMFPIMPMSLEELMSRMNPNYLVMVNSVLHVLSQGISMIVLLVGGKLLDNKNPTEAKDNAINIVLGVSITLSSLILLNVYILAVRKKDGMIGSVIQRVQAKKKMVDARKKKKNKRGGDGLTIVSEEDSGAPQFMSKPEISEPLGTEVGTVETTSHHNLGNDGPAKSQQTIDPLLETLDGDSVVPDRPVSNVSQIQEEEKESSENGLVPPKKNSEEIADFLAKQGFNQEEEEK